MKAKTKFQIEITDLAKQLSPITIAQLTWAKKNCLDHQAVVNKSGTATCLDCAHITKLSSSEAKKEKYKCHNCKSTLKTVHTLKRKFSDGAYFSIIDIVKDYQVIRNFEIKGSYVKNQTADIFCQELCQIWIAKNGKFEVYGKAHFLNWYQDSWTGTFEIRRKDRSSLIKYDINPFRIHPKMKLIDEIKRTGFNGKFYNLSPLSLFSKLLQNKYETLLKANQIALIKYESTENIHNYWNSIKICIRNSYVIPNASDWFDYLQLLAFFNKDLKNPKYICPADLKYEHDKYVEKKRQFDRKKKEADLLSEINEAQQKYQDIKSKYFGLTFGDDQINISVIESVRDFFNIGYDQNICVFTNEYHKRESSLLLVAKLENQILETIEISLKSFKIMQSRGKSNKITPYHERIENIVKDHIPIIQKLALAG